MFHIPFHFWTSIISRITRAWLYKAVKDSDCQSNANLTQEDIAVDHPGSLSTGGNFISTARIRSMTGRYCFHRCLSVNISGEGEGTPSRSGWWGVPYPRSRVGGYPIPGLGWGYPIPGRYPGQVLMMGEYPGYPPDQVLMVGGYPSQVWMVGGYPIPGVPQPGLDDGGYPGYPLARSGWWGVPQVPPTSRPGRGTLSPLDGVPPTIKT